MKKPELGAFLTAIPSGEIVSACTTLFGTVKASTEGLRVTAQVEV